MALVADAAAGLEDPVRAWYQRGWEGSRRADEGWEGGIGREQVEMKRANA